MEIIKLEEKVLKATEKVEKVKGTIARHEGILAKKIKARDEYGIKSKEREIKGAKDKLKEAQEILENWKVKLNKEIEKERFLEGNTPQAIKDFLEQWKKLAYDWHVKRYDEYQVFKANIDKLSKEAHREVGVKEGYFPTQEQKKILEEKKLDWKSVKARKFGFAGYNVSKMDEIRKEEERLAWIENLLEKEKKAKMMDLINRITEVVGIIEDAKGLEVSYKGNLDGIIRGTEGSARIETIGAGGYNIQCFHYRTLIHKL